MKCHRNSVTMFKMHFFFSPPWPSSNTGNPTLLLVVRGGLGGQPFFRDKESSKRRTWIQSHMHKVSQRAFPVCYQTLSLPLSSPWRRNLCPLTLLWMPVVRLQDSLCGNRNGKLNLFKKTFYVIYILDDCKEYGPYRICSNTKAGKEAEAKMLKKMREHTFSY